MNRADFELLNGIVRARSGLVLSPEKGYLLESRLNPLARQEGFASLEALVTQLRKTKDEKLAWAVTEAMTTNETFFFRDKTPFDTFREVILPQLVENRAPGQRLRIWCAAGSTGQEPYSLAMILDQERALLGGRQVDIIATDICSKALEKARAGVYTQFEVQRGLPVQMLVKYFEKVDELWRVAGPIRKAVTFKKFNLLDDYRGLGRFDVIFCRNVLIYFDQQTKRDVLTRAAVQCAPDAYLLLGAAETVMGLSDAFESIRGRRGLYQRTGADKAKAA